MRQEQIVLSHRRNFLLLVLLAPSLCARPPPSQRKRVSPAVHDAISDITKRMKDAVLAASSDVRPRSGKDALKLTFPHVRELCRSCRARPCPLPQSQPLQPALCSSKQPGVASLRRSRCFAALSRRQRWSETQRRRRRGCELQRRASAGGAGVERPARPPLRYASACQRPRTPRVEINAMLTSVIYYSQHERE